MVTTAPRLCAAFKYLNKQVDTRKGQQARQAPGLRCTEWRSGGLQAVLEASGQQAREMPEVDTRPKLWSRRESSSVGGKVLAELVGQMWGVLKSR